MGRQNALRTVRTLGLSALAAVAVGTAWFEPSNRAAALTSGTRAFSSEEERQLQAGKLVTRPTEFKRGSARLMGGLAWQLIDASTARVWRAVNDVHAYPHFLPAVAEARLIDRRGAQERLFIRHQLGFVNASYFVLATADASQNRVRFRLDHSRPGDLRDAFGELTVTPSPNGRCVVSLAILADVGDGLIAGLVRSNVHEWMLRVPEQLKKYIEKHPSPEPELEVDNAPAADVQSPVLPPG